VLLGEEEPTVGNHVELTVLALARVGIVAVAFELGRETRGPSVVAASDGAVEDLDSRHRSGL
jgi:hypothetical protein